MSLNPYNDNILILAPKDLDQRTGRFSGGAWRPYNDITEFNTIQVAGARFENQMFWVRSTTDSNKSDLYALRKDKTPYKVLDDIDLSNYYTQGQINTKVAELNTLISNALSAANTADAKATVALEDIDDLEIALSYETTRATQAENSKIPLAQKDAIGGVPSSSSSFFKFAINDLRNMMNVLPSEQVYVPDTGRSGPYKVIQGDTTSVDNGGGIIVTAAGQRLRRLIEGGGILWTWFKEDSDTDDAIAINKAIDYAGVMNMQSIMIDSQVNIYSKINVKTGIFLDFYGHAIPQYNRTTSQWVNLKGSIINVMFGKGLSADDFTNAAVELQQGAGIGHVSFRYPTQEMENLTPVSFPPAILIAQGSLESKVIDVNLGNAYVGIDARRDHANLKVENVNGYPLYRGIRVGGMIDNDAIADVHFNPQYTFTGTINKDNSAVNWVFNNGRVLELGRNSWSNYDNIFGYNYEYVVYGYKQIAGVTVGNTKTGGTETGNFKNIGGDSVKGVMYFEGKTDESGGTISGNSHWGVKVFNLNGVTKSAYDATNNTGTDVFKWTIASDATRGDFKVFGGRQWDCDDDVFDVDGGIGCLVSGYEFYDFAKKIASGKGVRLNNTKRMKIIGCEADGQNITPTQNRFIFLGINNTGTLATSNTVVDFNSYIVEIQLNGNSNYTFVGNNFTAGATTNAFLDSQADTASVIANNGDSRTATMAALSNSNVVSTDVGGGVMRNILVLPYQGVCFNYTGTLDIQGISGGRQNKFIFIRFSGNLVTVKDADSAVPLAMRLELLGDFQNKAESTLSLMTNGTYWWEIARSFNTTQIRDAVKPFTASIGMDKTANRWVYTGTVNATATLPQRSTLVDGFYYIKNESAFNLTVARGGSTDLIYDRSDVTSIVLGPGDSLSLYDNGAKWEVQGSSRTNKEGSKTVIAATTLALTDYGSNGELTVYLDATSGAFTLTLLPSATDSGLTTNVVKTDASANTITVKGSGTETINNANTDTTLSTQYASFILKSNGTKHFKF